MTDETTENPPGGEITTEQESEPEKSRAGIEIMAAILLGFAGLMTAYAAYFGALAGGDALQGYAKATIARNEANSYYSDYSQQLAQDTNVFLQYQVQIEEDNLVVAEVIRTRLFSPELEVAYVAWNELTGDDDVPTPMDTPEYVVEAYDSYLFNYDLSVALFDEAAVTDDLGDNMDLASVFLAVALFFAGIAALFKVRVLSFMLLGASALLLIPGAWAIAKGKGWIS